MLPLWRVIQCYLFIFLDMIKINFILENFENTKKSKNNLLFRENHYLYMDTSSLSSVVEIINIFISYFFHIALYFIFQCH